LLVPVKSLAGAKTRLAAASGDEPAHRALVTAIRADTLAAAAQAEPVARVVLVLDRPAPAGATGLAFVQTVPGLNGGLAEAAADAAARWPAEGVAALVGDLPALRPPELTDALQHAAGCPRSFVRDAAGTGTTLLAAAPGVPLQPQFGDGSAARHALIAAELPAAAGLRHDVDTPTDLAAAVALGVGEATGALLDGTGQRRSSASR
jgi:2-phospho-L-lactate guanylyltransferase